MAVRKVLRMGDPFLLRTAVPVAQFNTPELDGLIADLLDTMKAVNGAGLAAPQIGVGLRVVLFGFEKNPRYPDRGPVPMTTLINPRIEPLDDTLSEDWEGCLSVPGMRGRVPRYARIRYSGYTAQGEFFEREVDDFHARVVQHECDHLDGVLYPMRIRDMSSFGFLDELIAARRIAFPVAQDE